MRVEKPDRLFRRIYQPSKHFREQQQQEVESSSAWGLSNKTLEEDEEGKKKRFMRIKWIYNAIIKSWKWYGSECEICLVGVYSFREVKAFKIICFEEFSKMLASFSTQRNSNLCSGGGSCSRARINHFLSDAWNIVRKATSKVDVC